MYNVEMLRVIMECMNNKQLNKEQINNYISEIGPTQEINLKENMFFNI